MLEAVLNTSLVFYGTILRITFVGSFFVLKLQVVCLQSYWKYFPKFFTIPAFQNNRRLHPPETIAMSCFSCSISLKKYVYVESFAHGKLKSFLIKNYFMILESKNFDFKIMLTHKTNLTKFVGQLFERFEFWVYWR